MTRQVSLFNTATKSVDAFNPIEEGKAGVYCCGPTVYNYAHIGNLRTYIFEDLLRRTLEMAGFAVNHVMNITDVGHLQSDADEGDDKMLIASRREKKDPWQIARYYEDAFLRHIKMLGIKTPTTVCRATDHIKEMIDMVETLIERGLAYESDGNVYFEIAKFPDYHKLSGLKLDAQAQTERVEIDDKKRDQNDFALWFSTSKYPNQIMVWESPWGRGFPGWHIECSAMASRYLGDHFDIHCGGIDHVPVHHTNEIAQSEGCFGHKWVNYWLHGEFLLTDKEKMSKSSGDFLSLDRLVERGFDPLDLRYLYLTAHYRSALKFSFETLEGAKKARANLMKRISEWRKAGGAPDLAKVDEIWGEIWADISNDLHIPKALSALNTLSRDSSFSAADKLALWERAEQIFAIGLDHAVEEEQAGGADIPAHLLELVEQRHAARASKDWAKSDELRNQLATEGLVVKDTPQGPELTYNPQAKTPRGELNDRRWNSHGS